MLSQVMNGNPSPTIHSLFSKWKDEDRELDRYIDGVREWMNGVTQLGEPRFGEAANRLQRLLDRLTLHFAREDEMGEELESLYPDNSIEVQASCRQAEHDHDMLSNRLSELIARLDEIEPPFASWEAAMDEVESFVAALEQHEIQESDSIATLMPRVADS